MAAAVVAMTIVVKENVATDTAVADIDSSAGVSRTLPAQFVEQIQNYDIPEFAGLLDALASGNPAIAIRPNVIKGISLRTDLEPVVWNDAARYLADRPRFTFDPEFHQGLYYVQEPSSMIVGEIVRRLSSGMQRPVYLDACAAPGGKTTASIDALPDGAFVVANEFVPARASVLRDNLIKWGSPGVAVSRVDTAAFRKLCAVFDIIATDVPCSGEGMMRKEPEALAQWSPGLVKQCAALQREIVGNIWPALRPGGYLIYSTCTFNREENDANVEWIVNELGAEPVMMDFPESWGIVSEGCMHRFMPHRLCGEGLFVAVMRKPADGDEAISSKMKPSKPRKPEPVAKQVSGWLHGADDFTFTIKGDRINAFPTNWLPLLSRLEQTLNIIYAGVDVGVIKGRDVLPLHSLALSRVFDDKAFPMVEVDYVAAIAYLRRDTLTLPDGAPRGIVTLAYNGRPLGFVKNLGNRTNSLLPAEWRILSSHIPDTHQALILNS
ncbi:MAG: rRNA cytosine-C5-methyltransferase [Muribaculaceae bacterium]|nr:rRNA cytosine-C5-methyltransferase [Muribaculaceae bacterium]